MTCFSGRRESNHLKYYIMAVSICLLQRLKLHIEVSSGYEFSKSAEEIYGQVELQLAFNNH